MTDDDDAFLRTIVDNPGHDLPRLVYADWLDDRDDPRGPFLRAEVEWAQPWKDGQRPGDATELRAMAAGLDPLWVARVTRPPVGVCADHIRLTKSGPPLDSAELGHVEERLGVSFPATFRAFLSNFNGGIPNPGCLPYPPSFEWDDIDMTLGSFLSASRRGMKRPKKVPYFWEYEIEETLDHLNSLYRIGGGEGPNPLLSALIPIAGTRSDIDYFLLGVADEKRGRVYRFGDYCHHTNDPRFLSEYCESFPHLLSMIREERA